MSSISLTDQKTLKEVNERFHNTYKVKADVDRLYANIDTVVSICEESRRVLGEDTIIGCDQPPAHKGVDYDRNYLLNYYGMDILTNTQFIEEFRNHRRMIPDSVSNDVAADRANGFARAALGHNFPNKIVTITDTVKHNIDLYNRNSLQFIKEHYDVEQNPIFAWKAIDICSNIGQPIPDWVVSYLNESAKSVVSTLNGRELLEKGISPHINTNLNKPSRKEKETIIFAKALGIGNGQQGDSGCFKKALDIVREYEIYKYYRDNYNDTFLLKVIYANVATKFCISDELAQRIILRMKTMYDGGS